MSEESRQYRRWRERQSGAIHGPTSATPPSGEKLSAREWQIKFGIPATFVAVGMALIAMGPAFFKWGAILAYVSAGWLLFDWWYYYRRLSLLLRLIGMSGTVVIGAAISLVVFHWAPLSVSFLRITEHYADGVEIAGIKWSPKYSGFRIILRNDSDYAYSNIEFLIRSDVMIANIGFIAKFESCAAKPTLGPIEISGASIAPDGKNAVPLDLPMADMYKIVCDRLLPHDPVEIVVATRRNIIDGGFDEASSVAIRGSFEAFFKTRPLEKTECLIQGCKPIMIP